MPTDITINDITGSSPYNIYICDDPITTCFYVSSASTLPYTFQIPLAIDGDPSYNLKVIDNDNCTKIVNLVL